jgi:hypothetical protein
MYNKKRGDDSENSRTSFIKLFIDGTSFYCALLNLAFFLAKVCSYDSSHFFIYYKVESIYIISICWATETDLTGGHKD